MNGFARKTDKSELGSGPWLVFFAKIFNSRSTFQSVHPGMNWQRVYSPWRELVKSLSTEREPVKSTKLHIVFYLLQIISLLMSSVQKLPPEVSCSMLCSQFGSSEILGTLLLLATLFFIPPLQQSHSFFKLLSMLTEMQGGPPGMPCFTNLTLARIWEVRLFC